MVAISMVSKLLGVASHLIGTLMSQETHGLVPTCIWEFKEFLKIVRLSSWIVGFILRITLLQMRPKKLCYADQTMFELVLERVYL